MRVLTDQAGLVGDRGQHRPELQQRELTSEPEGLLIRPQVRRDREHSGVGIEAVQCSQALVIALDHPYPVLFAQSRHQRIAHVVAARSELSGELFGGGVEHPDVEVAIEEVADLLVRHERGGAVGTELAELFEGMPVAAVHRDDSLGEARLAADEAPELLTADLRVELVVEQHFTQLGHQSGGVLRGEETRIDPKYLRYPQKHRNGQRPGVVLELIQIAWRDLQGLCKLGLVEAAFFAQLPKPPAHECALHGKTIACSCEQHHWHDWQYAECRSRKLATAPPRPRLGNRSL